MKHFQATTQLGPDDFLAYAKSHDPVEVLDLIKKAGESYGHASQSRNLEIEMRSFLRHNGYNDVPKGKLEYMVQEWHRGYKREEIAKLLGYLDSKPHKLYVILALETGFRARTVLGVQYKHIQEDFEAGIVPCAVRLDPGFYRGSKSAGYTFIGERAVSLIRECIKDGLIKPSPDSNLVNLSYTNIFDVLTRAREKAGTDWKVQPSHGLRKYYENALDRAEIDHEKKMVLEGHFAGTRAKHYTDREWNELRQLYRKAYPFIDVEGSNPELSTKLETSEQKIGKLEKDIADLKAMIFDLQKKK
jgi:integrase